MLTEQASLARSMKSTALLIGAWASAPLPAYSLGMSRSETGTNRVAPGAALPDSAGAEPGRAPAAAQGRDRG
jgi:hypothetical protein